MKLIPNVLGLDEASIRQSLADELVHQIGKDENTASKRDWYRALATAIARRLNGRWLATQGRFEQADAKRVYYLSLEFLTGRALSNALINLGISEQVHAVLSDLDLDLGEIEQLEDDAGLGNGGLGRLAACYLDSMATLQLAGFGYGIRYDYGIFTQLIDADGQQIERAHKWLHYANVWETRRDDLRYLVHFGGRVVSVEDEDDHPGHAWVDTEDIVALAFDMPVPGNDGATVNHLRLWAGRAPRPFNLSQFNAGNYPAAVEDQIKAKNLSRILYPDDSTPQGQELRLRQQYFFVSASLQDILAKHLRQHEDLTSLPERVAIQLNDTHPALAIPEMMRLLVDEHRMEWSSAWQMTEQVFGYTNHTLLPEALEQWPVRLFERLLPRHLGIIYKINRDLLQQVRRRYPDDPDRCRRMSLIAEEGDRQIRMAYLAIVGSHKVNGVARLHSRLMQETIFSDYARMFPAKFTNVTNGVTPRRWLKESNPGLAQLIDSRIGSGWERDLGALQRLESHADDESFRAAFEAVKRANKERLVTEIARLTGVSVSADSLFDVQIKRIHEYKRQLLNLLYVIALYNRIRRDPQLDIVPRTVIFAGKAAPGYTMAKRIVHLINRIAATINSDPAVADKLKLIFIPDYSVSLAQLIVPAAELSQQISTAGMEASGTGNMKLALNGALTIGTLDGANIEIREEVGPENIFIFGLTAEEVTERRASGYDPRACLEGDESLREVINMIFDGAFSPDNRDEFTPVIDCLLNQGEHFLVLADYAAYAEAQERVDALYRDRAEWIRRAILNTARMGYFSSDRSVREYARSIWRVKPVPPTAAELEASNGGRGPAASG